LCRMEVKDRCCWISELSAVVDINASTRSGSDGGADFKIITENAAFARRVFSAIKELFNINAEVVIRKSKKTEKTYSIFNRCHTFC
jgi:DNA-binding protein WhiA